MYIRIPCNGLCDYTFYYKVYTKENLIINNSECFDINIIGNHLDLNYNRKSDENISLFTMTSYSLEDFNVKLNSYEELKKTFFNGYSYLINNSDTNMETDLKFTIDKNLRIKACHRYLKNSYIKNDDIKNIFVGDIKYSSINSYNKIDCFSIYKDSDSDLLNYKINFITKTKNLKIELYEDKKINSLVDYYDLPKEESFSYEFESSINGFCISSSDENNASALFQLLSIKETSYINQSLVMPLIKGISTRQNLR